MNFKIAKSLSSLLETHLVLKSNLSKPSKRTLSSSSLCPISAWNAIEEISDDVNR